MKKKTKRHALDSQVWSATNAARKIIDLRDLTLERCDHLIAHTDDSANAYLRMRALDHRKAYDTYTRVFHANGYTTVKARRNAAEMLGLEKIPSSGEDWIAAAAHTLSANLKGIRTGELYITSPAMHLTTLAAAATLAPDDLVQIEWLDIPSDEGMLLLPAHVLVQEDEVDSPKDVIALSWQRDKIEVDGNALPSLLVTMWIDIDGPVKNPGFDSAREMSSSAGLDFPPLLEAGRVGVVPRGAGDEARIGSDADSWFRLTSAAGHFPNAPETVVDIASPNEIQRRSGNEWLLAYMTAFWRLARQRIATVAPFRDGLPEDAPYRPHHETRVVQLRAFSAFDLNKGESGRQYHHRWIVRMHKVNQWYPSEGVHRIIWRGPYIKGPENAPLLAGERVQALVR